MKILKLKDVQKLNNYKHNLLDKSKAENITSVVSNLIGLHSARLITPYATLIPRVKNFIFEDLTNELFVNNNLIKLRCMRKTLHTVSLDLAPIVHQSTKSFRLSICNGIYKKLQISDYKIKKIKELILESVELTDLSSKDIEEYISHKNKNINILESRAVIKELWEKGLLCYINKSEYWGKEVRLYGLTRRKYPTLNLNEMSVTKSQMYLVQMHINCYGPVTEKDISWWSGLSISTIRICIKLIANEISTVSIKELKGVFYINSLELSKVEGLEAPNKLTLLAYEDPSLKGYYESRERYVSPKHYNQLFNPIGEARASILKNGKVIGIWFWDKKNLNITTSLFTSLSLQERTNLTKIVKDSQLLLAPKMKQLKLFSNNQYIN